ncbi:hypothetical protein ACEWY4_022633 [Coilia grayii]|uniref:CCHC-type domain-containing protein n=1 Tax=Coilia grayii TaxID=363190 RepID=A0ABD1J8Z5_9TELE
MSNPEDSGPSHSGGATAQSLARPVFMPETFTGTGREWSDWVAQFEVAAEVNGWDDSLKMKFLSLLLSGRARELYSGLPLASRNNYITLKEALGRCLEPCDSADWNRANFLSRRRLLNESVRDFGIALRRLIHKAYPSADNVTRDMFARDHFVEHVGSGDLRIHLRSQKPETLEEAINIAAELELIKSLEITHISHDSKVRAITDKSPSDKQMELLLGVVEGLRQEVNALQQTVTSLQPTITHGIRRDRDDERRRGRQGGPGRQAPVSARDACWECGCTRHLRRDCPYLQGN